MMESGMRGPGALVRYEGMSLADLELWQAVHQGSAKAAEEALAQGADPSSVSERGEGLVARAARMLGEGAGTARLNCLMALLEAGGDANSADSRGRSALALAAKAGSLRAVEALLAFGADAKASCEEGSTALHWAAMREGSQMIEALAGAGGDPNALNRFGEAPLWLAASQNHPLALAALLRSGADAKLGRAPNGRRWAGACEELLRAAMAREELDRETPAGAARSGRANGL